MAETGDPEPTTSLSYKRILAFWNSYQYVPYLWSMDRGPYVLRQQNGAPGNHVR